MLPYSWLAPVMPPPPLHQHLQQPQPQPQQPHPATTSSPAESTASSSSYSSCQMMTRDNYCLTVDDGFTATDSDSDWNWIDEDRLMRTPVEQRVLEERVIEEQTAQAACIANLELSTFPTLCDFLSIDSSAGRDRMRGRGHCRDGETSCGVTLKSNRRLRHHQAPSSAERIASKAAWRTANLMLGDGDVSCMLSAAMPPPLPPPMPPSAEILRAQSTAKQSCNSHQHLEKRMQKRQTKDHCGQAIYHQQVIARAQANNSNLQQQTAASSAKIANVGAGASQQQAVASGRSLQEIETAVQLTRNNSNQQQRYEMRGGHTVEICSRVEFPDRGTRNVSVTVEATHSNGCHRVIMLKGLTAKKRPDLGPKVKDCRLRMDQIVMTRPSTSAQDWLKTITMSYDSDFQVGVGEEKSRAL